MKYKCKCGHVQNDASYCEYCGELGLEPVEIKPPMDGDTKGEK